MLNPVREALARLACQLNCAPPPWTQAADDHLPIDATLMPLDLAGLRLPRPSATMAAVPATTSAPHLASGTTVAKAA